MATIYASEPQPRQVEFLKAKSLYVCFGGARGGGKSWALDFKGVAMSSNYDGLRICLIRRSYTDLLENHIEPIKGMLRDLIDKKLVKYSNEEHTFIFWNGSRIKCDYCNCKADLDHFMGKSYDIVMLDEATQFEEEVFLSLQATIRGNPHLPKRFYLTCNPGGVGHEWVKRLFVSREYKEDENPDDYTFIKSLATDNIYNGKGYMNMLNKLQEPLRSAWRDGDWDTFVGQFFPEWDIDKLTVDRFDEIPAHWRISMSIDYGLDCFAPLWFGTDENGVSYILKEHSESNVLIPQAAQKIKSIEESLGIADRKIYRYAPRDLWGRKSNTGLTTIDSFNQYGIRFVKVDSGREEGWQQVKTRISDGTLRVFRDAAPRLSYCMRLIQFDEHDSNDVATTPHDITHLPDSLRYFLVTRSQKAKLTAPVYTNNIIDRRGNSRTARNRSVGNAPRINIGGLKGGW